LVPASDFRLSGGGSGSVHRSLGPALPGLLCQGARIIADAAYSIGQTEFESGLPRRQESALLRSTNWGKRGPRVFSPCRPVGTSLLNYNVLSNDADCCPSECHNN
jgi:hypothetical protein